MSRPRCSTTGTRQTPHVRGGGLPGRLLAVGMMAVLLAAGAILGFASTAWAAAGPPVLALRAEQAPRDPHGIELVATLTGPGGSASTAGSLAGDSVNFSVHLAEFAGAPLLTLGSATTNAAGRAVLTYHPTWTGHQALVATATDTSGATIASATTSFAATGAVHSFAGTIEAVRPDGTIGQAVAGVLIAIVTVLWITLIAVVVRLNLGFRRRPYGRVEPGRSD